jgi:hypothetical protein
MRLSLLITALVSIIALLPASASAQATAVCPATFDVLHDDQIGSVSLRAGSYDVTVRGGLSCANASDLFREFLEDYDGRLPGGWRVTQTTGGGASFSGRRGVGFTAARAAGPHGGGGGQHPHGGARCPGTFRVLHNDRIGPLRLSRGSYRITLLSTHNLSCARASRLFAQFLQDYDGALPRPWALNVQTATFRRGAASYGFRVKPWSGANTGGGGSGVHPRAGRCPNTFQVLNNTRIGRLKLPRGRYWIYLLSARGLTCQQAASQFTRFLDEDFAGMLPSPWALNVGTATFTRGAGSQVGFRVKPVRG